MQEIFKDIQGFENLYKVSNKGAVFSIRSNKIIAQDPSSSKSAIYKRVTLHSKGTATKFLVHRLVAIYFIPNPQNKPQVNHIDNDTTNNVVTNLEWCTASENMKHSRDQGRQDKVTAIATKAMAKANLAKSERKYDAFVGTSLNGRTLSSYYKHGKHYKGNFVCDKCSNIFTAHLDASIRNITRELPCYCRSCTKKGKDIV